MNWSRVLDVYSVKDNNVKSFDVETDLQKDRVMQLIYKHIDNEPNEFLFDPTVLDNQEVQLTQEEY